MCSIYIAGDSHSLTRLLEGLTDLMNENSTAEYNTHTLIPEAQLKLKKAHRTKGNKRTSQGGASTEQRALQSTTIRFPCNGTKVTRTACYKQ